MKTKETKNGGYVTIYDGETPLLDRILDPNDKDPIVIESTEGPIEFEQIAYIPYQESVFVVMHNITPLEDIEEDACMIFRYVQENGEEALLLESDEEVVNTVYETYISLLNG